MEDLEGVEDTARCATCGKADWHNGQGEPECRDCYYERGRGGPVEPHVVLYNNPDFPGIYGPFASRQQAESWLFEELRGMGLEGDTLEALQAEYAETDATGSGGWSATVQPLIRAYADEVQQCSS